MPNFELLSGEYELHRKTLSKEKLVGLAGALAGLKKVLGSKGPDQSHADSLDYLRKHALKGDEAVKIMEFAGLDPTAVTTPAEANVKKAAAIKFLRHLYMVGGRDNQQVWVVATPSAYTAWPGKELDTVKTSHAQVKNKLAEVAEQFPLDTRTKLGEAMMMALGWAEAAKRTLAAAKNDAAAMVKVKRWFDDGTISAKDLTKNIAKMQAGFKVIVNSLNSHLVMITEMPSLRADASQDLTEAFVLSTSGKMERPRTLYIEKALMENYNVSVLQDMKKNWARVLLHECTHTDAKTEDKRYAFRGIRPGGHIDAAEAAINADSWAFFAADAADALTDGDKTRALGGTGGGAPAKGVKNWN